MKNGVRTIREFLFALTILVFVFASFGVRAGSQVSGNIFGNANMTLTGPQSVGSSTYQLQLSSLFSQNFLQYGTNNGVGTSAANQLYAGSFTLTNGALVGTNWLNLSNMNGTADPVGNLYTLRNLKLLIFQNYGASTNYGYFETNIAQIQTTGTAAGWTNLFGTNNSTSGGITITGPSQSTNLQTGTVGVNYPTTVFWSPGDVGWPVGGSANTIVLTNPVAGSVPVTVYVYAIGSTNQ